MKQTSLRAEQRIIDEAAKLAERHDRSVNYMLRKCLNRYWSEFVKEFDREPSHAS